MNDYTRKNMRNRKRRIERRLGERHWKDQSARMFSASNMHYEMGERMRDTGVGGLGAMHRVARRTGLIEAIDARVDVLKRHLPYHESDHVLNIAYNALTGGTCLEDIELRRNDEAYLDALGAQRIPDPATAGDFCRRFEPGDVENLMEAANEVRLNVWRQQPAGFFDEAVLDADGTLAPTSGECKEGMDIAYDGTWGYHPLLISLAQTQEPLYLVNRSSNRATMVMASLAWTLKAWFALLLPETGRWAQKYRAEKQTVLRMGVQDVPERLHPPAVPTRAYRPAHRLPAHGLEPVVVRLVPCRGCVASSPAMLTRSWI